eukprot:g9589.t1
MFAQEGTAAALMERYALPSAICADGSPGFFYMAANTSSKNFIFHLMGGGGCAYNETYCEEIREISAPLLTSDGWPDVTVGSGLLSADSAENPLYSTFNRVFVPYCTQDMFLLDTESPSGELQFRGRPYLEEIFTSVLGQSPELSTAVLSGSSAGGVGAFNVVNWLLDSFEQVTELSVVLDSAFFFDVDGTLTVGLDYLREHPAAAYGNQCSEEFDGGPCCIQFGCMVQRGYYPTEDDRLKGTMILSPAQDSLPLFLETAESVTKTAAVITQDEDEDVALASLWDVAAYTGHARSLLRNIASMYPAAISVFSPSCTDHYLVVSTSAELWMCSPGYEKPIAQEYYDDFVCTVGEEDERPVAATYVRTLDGVGLRIKFAFAVEAWESLQIDGTSMRTATEQWWAGRGDASKQVFRFDSCNDLNCNPTCQSGLLPGTRDESDAVLVWALVLAIFMFAMLVLIAEGALCALMGPSGSGKSTLLDLLTGRKDFGRCDGEVLFRGRSIADQPKVYISQSGYMRQMNTGYLDDLTVLENLVYAAMLRLPGTLEHQSQRVYTVIEQTLLGKSAHTMASGLSGGQKRRLKIALELLVDRKIFFLDEPSSGLDASASLELVAVLQRLSRKVTLVVAIHQPRPEVWELFSHAILLSGGRTVYCGPTDNALAGTASYLMDAIPHKSSNLGHEPATVIRNGDFRRTTASRPRATPSKAFRASVLRTTRGLFSSNFSKTVGPVARTVPITSPKRNQETAACHLERVGDIFRMQRWNSSGGCRQTLNLRGGNVEGNMSATSLARASLEERNVSHAGPMHTGRSIPDKILDRLMMIEDEFAGKLQVEEEGEALYSSCGDGGLHECMSSVEPAGRRSKSSATSVMPKEIYDSSVSAGDSCEKCKTSAWKLAAVLIARSFKSSFARELVSAFWVLVVSLTFVVVSLRVASNEAMMLHLVMSVLCVSMLPVLLVYCPVMLISMHDGWPLTKLEIADGFYSPRSATLRIVIEHFAPAVFLSFVTVGITHIAFWDDFISALPVSAIGVDLQLACAMTLTAWVAIALFDALVISRLSLSQACGISNAFNTIWAVFSGTILLVTSIPAVLRAVTFLSPHYWATFFGLRVLLDGLDLTASCDDSSKIYCPASYGDLVANALDLHIHTTGQSLACLVAMASAGLAAFATMVHFRGRNVRVTERLGKPKDGFGELSCSITERSGSTDVESRDSMDIQG